MVLPAGISRLDFLLEAQRLTRDLFNRDLVDEHRVHVWSQLREFAVTAGNATEIAAEPVTLSDLSLADLALVFAAYFLLTAKDISGGKIVPTAVEGALSFKADGLRFHAPGFFWNSQKSAA